MRQPSSRSTRPITTSSGRWSDGRPTRGFDVGYITPTEIRPKAMPGGFAGGGGHRARAAECGECRFAAEPVDVLSGGDEQPAGVTGGDPEQPRRARRCLADERLELPVEDADLAVERVDAPGDRSQRELRGVHRPLQLAHRGS